MAHQPEEHRHPDLTQLVLDGIQPGSTFTAANGVPV